MADTDVRPETDTESVGAEARDKAGTSHLSQGVNTDDLPLANGVPVTDED